MQDFRFVPPPARACRLSFLGHKCRRLILVPRCPDLHLTICRTAWALPSVSWRTCDLSTCTSFRSRKLCFWLIKAVYLISPHFHFFKPCKSVVKAVMSWRVVMVAIFGGRKTQQLMGCGVNMGRQQGRGRVTCNQQHAFSLALSQSPAFQPPSPG